MNEREILHDSFVAKKLMAGPEWEFLSKIAEKIVNGFVAEAMQPIDDKEAALQRLALAQAAKKFWETMHNAVHRYAANGEQGNNQIQ